jgi:sensor histidine kinase regulating citrate/malate metabolism
MRSGTARPARRSPILLTLQVQGGRAVVGIHNSGPAIAPDLLERIFEYGVSSDAQAQPERRGQGLFVARTYMAKMGGTVEAHNRDGGVVFELAFPLDSV